MASRAGHCEVAEFLLQNAAPVDAKAKVQRSPTHIVMFPNSFIFFLATCQETISSYKQLLTIVNCKCEIIHRIMLTPVVNIEHIVSAKSFLSHR